MAILINSKNTESNKFTITVDSIPDLTLIYPITVTAILEDGTTLTETKNVKLLSMPVNDLVITGDTLIGASGTAEFNVQWLPENANIQVTSMTVSVVETEDGDTRTV